VLPVVFVGKMASGGCGQAADSSLTNPAQTTQQQQTQPPIARIAMHVPY